MARGRLSQSCSVCAISLPGGISLCSTPCPAVIHCTSPARSRPCAPVWSRCSSAPSSTIVTVCMPRWGCSSKPAGAWNQSSLRNRNGEVRSQPSAPITESLFCTWLVAPREIASATREMGLFKLYAGGLDRAPPSGKLIRDHRRVLLRRAGAGLEAELCHRLGHVSAGNGLVYLGVKTLDDLARRARRRGQAEPGRKHVVRQTGLRGGGHLGQPLETRRIRHR